MGSEVVEVMGPFLRTDKGNQYVLAAMEYFTKWPDAYAIPDQEAKTVADALVEGMFAMFGAAKVMHSDQGRNFESGVFFAMCDCLGMQKTPTTPLHPQSDGLVKWFNRTLAKQLTILTAEHQSDWTCTSLLSHWPTGQLCRIPPHTHLPCSSWGKSFRRQQKWLLADPQTHQRFHLDHIKPGGSRTEWSQLKPLPATSCRKWA